MHANRQPSSDQLTEESAPDIDPRHFRRTLGRFATGVTVVTVARPEGPHGMTANAFLSVSLDPPLVLVSVDRRARMHAYLAEATRYGVSILARDQEIAARHFAGSRSRDSIRSSAGWPGCPYLKAQWRNSSVMSGNGYQRVITRWSWGGFAGWITGIGNRSSFLVVTSAVSRSSCTIPACGGGELVAVGKGRGS